MSFAIEMMLSPRTLAGMWARSMQLELKRADIGRVAIAADLSQDFCDAAKACCEISLYDSLLSVKAPDFTERFARALNDAEALGAKQIAFSAYGADRSALQTAAEAARRRGTEVLACIRGDAGQGASANAETLCDACIQAGVRMIFDVGFCHARGSALEDLCDCLPALGAVYLNDNAGFSEGGDDAQWQIGYGTAPIGAIGETLRAFAPDIPLYQTGAPHKDFPFVDPDYSLLLRETCAALSGRVRVNPAGGWLARDTVSGRLTR